MKRPTGEIKPLFLIFLIFPLLLCGASALWWPLLEPLELALAVTLHLAIAVVYIQTYPAIATEIPSFRILRLAESAGPGGASMEELITQMGQGELVGSRQSLMTEDGLVIESAEGMSLTTAGKLLAVAFLTYRKLLGLGEGGG
ncbi:MAG: hypothetical protein RRB13_14725 [bacterium]|nr:hypothetical protein [bacterium]